MATHPHARNHSLAGLRDLRKHRHVSIREAADAIGVAETSFVRYENGSRRMYFDHAIAIAKLLQCSLDDLIQWRSETEIWDIFGPPGRPLTDAPPPLASVEEALGNQLPQGNSVPAPPPPTVDELENEGWRVEP